MRALDVAGKTHAPADVAEAVKAGKMQAWTRGDSLVVTEVLEYPRRNALNVFLAVGNLDEVLSLIPDMAAFGREHGCTTMRMQGRRGWARVLPRLGWQEEKQVIYERAL
jgi:hypothetical protein